MLSGYGIALGVRQRLYPYEASIQSALNICDEYNILYDPRFDDPVIFSNIDKRVNPIEHNYDFLEWDFINFALTKARRLCRGSWCLYLEMDEVLHEKDSNNILDGLRLAEDNDKESVSIRYIDIMGDYSLAHGYRQKITKNIPEIYHKTSRYMIGKCDSNVWDGRYILPGFDDVAYYDSRTDAWFNDSKTTYLNGEVVFIWHYAWYNPNRKHEQGRQNQMWQNRTYARSMDYNPDEIIKLMQEHIIVSNNISPVDLGYFTSHGFIKGELNHPKVVLDWIRRMK